MAVVATRVNVGTTPGVLASNPVSSAEGDFRTQRFLLRNLTATAAVFLGGSGTTSGNGFQWDPSTGALEVELEPGESLYAVVAVTAQVVHVLATGR